MASNPAEKKMAPVIHVRADSDSCLEELFTLALKPPPGAQPMMSKPLRLRNLPQSFFNPPQSGGSRSPRFDFI
jgi:protein yorkie